MFYVQGVSEVYILIFWRKFLFVFAEIIFILNFHVMTSRDIGC